MNEDLILNELKPLSQSIYLMQVQKQNESNTGVVRFLSTIKNKISNTLGFRHRNIEHIFKPEFPYVPSKVLISELIDQWRSICDPLCSYDHRTEGL